MIVILAMTFGLLIGYSLGRIKGRTEIIHYSFYLSQDDNFKYLGETAIDWDKEFKALRKREE